VMSVLGETAINSTFMGNPIIVRDVTVESEGILLVMPRIENCATIILSSRIEIFFTKGFTLNYCTDIHSCTVTRSPTDTVTFQKVIIMGAFLKAPATQTTLGSQQASPLPSQPATRPLQIASTSWLPTQKQKIHLKVYLI